MNEDTVEVKIEPEELVFAVAVANGLNRLRQGDAHRYGANAKDGLSLNVTGCIGELAVAKWLNIWWNGDIGIPGRFDVAKFQVRSTSLENGRLLIHPPVVIEKDGREKKGDDPEDVFILAVYLKTKVILAGWIDGASAQIPMYWYVPKVKPGEDERPAYFVPQGHLKPMYLLDKYR